MDSYIYKDILNKIEKAEKSIKRLEMDGFLIDKKEFRDIVANAKMPNNKSSEKVMRKSVFLGDLLRHLNRLEKIDNYYKWTKFRVNSDNNIRLFLDAYVRDTLEIIKVVNEEIREYGFSYLEKFVTKFYNLIYFLIKLEIGLNGESEIYKEVFDHSSHYYCLKELMFSDINRTFDEALERQKYKEQLKEKNYDNYNQVIIGLINGDYKVRKLLNLKENEKLEVNKLIKKKN